MNIRKHEHLKATALLVLALGTLALAACSSGEAKTEAGMETPKVWGYVTGEQFARLDVVDQPGVKMRSPARAFFVNDEGLAKVVAVKAPGVGVTDGQPAMDTTDQTVVATESSMPAAVPQEASMETAASKDDVMETAASKDAPMDTAPSQDAPMDTAPSQDAPMDTAPSQDAPMDTAASQDAPMDSPSTESEPPAWGVLGGFLAFYAGIIAFAALLKRRNAKALPEGG